MTVLIRKSDTVAGALFLLAAGVRIALGPLVIDDAYITFRYVRNLADGLGFAYNPGEPVLGTTTPLWTLLLLPGAMAGLSIPWVAVVLSALCDGLTAVLLLRLGLRFGRPVTGLLAALMFALVPQSALFAVSGMETSLFVALGVAACTCYLEARTIAAGTLCGLLLLTRPDGVLFALVLAAHVLVVRRTLPWRAVVAALAVALPWVVFAGLSFGSPVPHSAQAKLAYSVHAGGWENIRLFLGVYAGSPLRILLFCLFLAGAVRVVARERIWLPFLAPFFAYAVALGLATSGVGPFKWYFAPALPAYLFFAALPVELTLSRLSTKVSGRLCAAACVLLLAHGAWNLPRNADYKRDNLAHREDLYRAIGTWSAAHLPKDAVIAAREIGALGFYSGSPIMDLNGLVSPDVLDHLTTRGLDGLIASRWPDLIVCLSGHYPCSSGGAFAGSDMYRPVRIPTAEDTVTVFTHRKHLDTVARYPIRAGNREEFGL